MNFKKNKEHRDFVDLSM
jgi:hypothetical protein